MSSSPILDYLTQHAWALHAPVFESLVQVVRRHVAGVRLAQDEIDAIVAARDQRAPDFSGSYQRIRSVGVVPVRGVIARHAAQVNGTSQPRGTSVEQLHGALAGAMRDPDVASVLLAIDSPGGSVNGVDEFAAAVAEANATKPVYALADGMMASAAYWIGAQARKVYATRSSAVGSIGVIATVVDEHRALANEGVDVHYITSAPAKVAGASGKPMDQADRSTIQKEVQAYHDLFVDAVARGRGVQRSTAEAWADGHVHLGREAKARGLVDEVKSINTIIAEMDAAHGAAVSARSPAAVSAMHRATTEEVPSMASVNPFETVSVTTPTSAQPVITLPSPGPTITQAWVEQNHPQLVAVWLAEGAKAERKRIAEIHSLAGAGQTQLAERMIAEGRSPDEAARAFALDHKEQGAAHLAAMRKDSAPLGSPPPLEILEKTGAQDPASAEFKANVQRRWQSDAKARKLFAGNFDAFLIDRQNVARGHYPDPLEA